MVLKLFENFEDGLKDWDVNDLSIVTDRKFEGSSSGYCDTAQSGQPQATRIISENGERIQKFQYFYNETSSGSYGSGIRLFDSDNNFVVGVATNNPQYDYEGADGIKNNGSAGEYDIWIKVTIAFDWAEGTADIVWEKQNDSTTSSVQDVPLASGKNVRKLQIEDYTNSNWQDGRNIETWFDEIGYEPEKRTVHGDLVGWWKLEGNGSDSSSYGNDGVLSGTYSTNVGVIGDCIDFSSGRLDIPNSRSLQVSGDLTISMWLKPDNFDSRKNPINKAYGGEYTITQETGGSLNFYYGTYGGDSSSYQGFTSSSLNTGEWQHVCIVRDFGRGELRWYINGELDRTTTADFEYAEPSPDDVWIGEGYTNPYDGEIDDVRIYNGALSQDKIVELSRAKVGHWKFDGNTGQLYEVGKANVNGWTTIALDHNYQNPVVVATGQEGADISMDVEASRPIVRNVTSNSFEVKVQNDQGEEPSEEVGYVVMEEGHHTISGVEIEAGTYEYEGGRYTFNYKQDFPNTTTVVDTVQQETSEPISTRYSSFNSGSFVTEYIEGFTTNDWSFGAKEIGYIAMQRETSDWVEGDVETSVDEDPSGGDWRTVNFDQTYKSEPVFLTNPLSSSGGDPTVVGRQNLTASSVDVRCTEDRVTDSEQAHATNNVPYLVFENTQQATNDTVYDATEFNNNGAVNGIEYVENSKTGSYSAFFGVDDGDFVEIPPSPELNSRRFESIAFWCNVEQDINTTGNNDYRRVYSLGNDNYRSIIFEQGAEINYSAGYSTNRRSTRVLDYDIGQWNHFVCTFDHETGIQKIYKNGSEIGSSDYGTDVNLMKDKSGSNLLISTSASNRCMVGEIDDFRRYNRALSQEEVEQLYKRRAAVDDKSGFHSKEFEEMRKHTLIDDQTFTASSNEYKNLATITPVETDVSDFEENDGTLGNVAIKGQVRIEDETYVVDRFEYKYPNNGDGYMFYISSQEQSSGWNNFILKNPSPDTPEDMDWFDASRLEIYRTGPDAGDSSVEIQLRNVELVKYEDNSDVTQSIESTGVSKSGQYNEIAVTDGLQAYIKLDGEADDVVSGVEGEDNGHLPTRPGKVGNSLNFAGVEEYVRIPKQYSCLQGASARTVSVWAKADAYVNGAGVFSAGTSSTGRDFTLRTTGTQGQFMAQLWGIDEMYSLSSDDFGWHHHVFTYDGSTFKVFVDGDEVFGGSKTLDTLPTDLFIGNWQSSDSIRTDSSYFFNGKIDDLRVYDRELNKTEVERIYQSAQEKVQRLDVDETSAQQFHEKTL